MPHSRNKEELAFSLHMSIFEHTHTHHTHTHTFIYIYIYICFLFFSSKKSISLCKSYDLKKNVKQVFYFFWIINALSDQSVADIADNFTVRGYEEEKENNKNHVSPISCIYTHNRNSRSQCHDSAMSAVIFLVWTNRGM